jgi:hypothetical protein
MASSKLCAGDLVEVRSKKEILSTLDKQGQLEGLPFMPQMFNYCGKRFHVLKRAHKTCDTVFPIRGRRMANAVHLDVRCDGQAYGGCQAGCLIFWKDAWLKKVNPDVINELVRTSPDTSIVGADTQCSEENVVAGTQAPATEGDSEPTYVCQATRLPYYTTDLQWWDLWQYIEDLTSGNIGIGQFFRGLVYSTYYNLSNAGIGVGSLMRWSYDRFQSFVGGVPYPRKRGTIPAGQKTPFSVLNLEPGELVRVKSYEEILATLNTENRNRGLYFDAEAVPYCGGTYRVRTRVDRIVDEKTGKLLKMKNESIILDGVFCEARYSDCRMFCPRGIYSYWREGWLERVAEPQTPNGGAKAPNMEYHSGVNVP